ncbi:hypothetical protein NK6_6290 [Bradyrhizobium diazoefficiens]|jgi:hypothetical protein|uniref:Uncharacterized protein n=1 Tax=Bradyrhizobium diazoefficiens TaxID=1355477 RepID=A0A0E4FXH1_9BRAD|nr:hypothetical protein NK6_6290 [Bradyrhizobium diazoefficiens]
MHDASMRDTYQYGCDHAMTHAHDDDVTTRQSRARL